MFKKITAIGASALMVGMTMGVAAAANFPAPFSGQPASGVAVVTGSGSGVDDGVAAGDISNYLATKVSGSTAGTVSSGGESYKFEKPSTKFHLGDNVTGVITSSIDDDELPGLLADGIFVDDDNDEFDYTQKINVGSNVQLTMFEDNDYRVDEPSVGFRIPNGKEVLTYTLDFSDEPLFLDLPTADIMFMGKSYYILSETNASSGAVLTLLDSAEDTVLSEGETATVSGKQVSITFISSTEVKLSVDGEITNTLAEGETQKMSGGAYVGIKDILFNSKDAGISKVDFSIGNGKLKLKSGQDLEINEDTVSGMAVSITNSSDGAKVSNIKLTWNTEDDSFIMTDSDLTMPGFEIVKMLFGGLTYPVEETIEVKASGTTEIGLEKFPVKDSVEDIPLLFATTAGTFVGLGKDATGNQLVTAAPSGNATLTFDSDTDGMFIASWSDGNDGESYIVRAQGFKTDGVVDKVDLKYSVGGVFTGTFQNEVKAGDTFSQGNVEIIIYDVNNTANTVLLGNNSASTNFNTLYSKEGMKVFLPYLAANTSAVEGSINLTDTSTGTTGHNGTSWFLAMYEEDKDDNIAKGDWINITLGWDATPETEVTAIVTTNADATPTEIGDTDVWRDFTYSHLATEILYDKPTGQKSVKLIYHGTEVAADVYISSPSVSVSGVEAGNLVFKDNEKASWSDRHVVLVGGSCINSATAEVLGVSLGTCASDFTGATNVGDGEYMIKSVGNAFTSGKIALVVAGYNKADTQAAASKLVNSPQDVDTTSGKEYRGKTGVTGSLAFSEVQ